MVMDTLRRCMDAGYLSVLVPSSSPTPFITNGTDMPTIPSVVPLVHVLVSDG